jgi:hypothetical protein
MIGTATEYQPAFRMSEPEEQKYMEILGKVGKEREAFDYWLRWKILTDLFFFGNEVLGWRYACSKYNYPGERRKRYRVDPEFHRWMADKLQLPGDKMIIVPRLHLKSTWAKLKMTQDVLNEPNIRIGFFSATANLVRKELKDIKNIFSHPMVLRLFHDRVPKPGKKFINWDLSNEDELTVKRDPSLGKIPQEPQISVFGLGANIVGLHLDKAYIDDAVTYENTGTPDLIEKAVDWWQYLFPILETEAEITYTGTPYHYNDLTARIAREHQIKNIYWRSNVENGEPVYKSWYSNLDWPKMEKRMGRAKFNAQIKCDATPTEDKPFPPPQPTFHMPLPLDERGYRYYCLIDPAATIKDYSDSTAFNIIAVNWINVIYAVESFSMKKRGDEIADVLIRKFLMYGFKMIGIELGLQEHLRTIIDMKIAEYQLRTGKTLRLPIMSVPITKQNKGDRISNTLGPLVRTGHYYINATLTRLIDQMDMFTGRKGDEDDEIDAASMCVHVIETLPQHYSLDQGFRKEGMTWKEFHHGKKDGYYKKVAGY